MKYTNQLRSILKASGWPQSQIAIQLGVSFQTVNAWINERSMPRRQARLRIEKLYLDIVGVEEVDMATLKNAKLSAQQKVVSARQLFGNKNSVDKLTLYLTYHTNTIEGSTMTLADVENVIFDHKVLTNRSLVEQAEARNHQATLHWLLEQMSKSGKHFTINESLILGIHLRLMNGIISDAGEYRTHPVRILGAKVALANWLKIPQLISELITEINSPTNDPIVHLAKIHADFEQIHPFSDGNGRAGRLLLLAQAIKLGLIPPIVVKERKYAYYKYLELAQTRGNYQPLELFISESIQFSSKLMQP